MSGAHCKDLFVFREHFGKSDPTEQSDTRCCCVFEIRVAPMELKFIAVRNRNRDIWEEPLADQIAWFRANKLPQYMADMGIAPVTQCMDPFVRLLACAPGPNTVSVFGGTHTEYQVCHTLRNSDCADIADSSYT